MNLLALQHHDIESPGKLGVSLQNLGHRLTIHRPDRDGEDALPSTVKPFDGVIVMGGPQNVDAAGILESPWLKAESELVREAHQSEMPLIGVCLGAQLIAHALGGEVQAMKTPEAGFAPVRITTSGQVNPIMAGLPWDSPQFHVHEYEVAELPAGATLLASSDSCAHQAFQVGLRTYGFQYHFECDSMMAEAFYTKCRSMFDGIGCSKEEFASQMDKHFAMYEHAADRLCDTIAQLLFPYVSNHSA